MLNSKQKKKVIHDFNSGIHGLEQAIYLLDNGANKDREMYQKLLPLMKEKIKILSSEWSKLKEII